jgi:eukaryotic-like serine/threonine-protein kinase
MNRDRWVRIDELCQAALEREPAERGAFLREACAGDEELLREVESLLAQQSEAHAFLEVPAAALDGGLPSDVGVPREALAPGARLGPYEVVSQIGAGGMGEVYKAKDTRLGRTVAIKILPPELSADPDRRARFEREAKTIAGLTHPHICTLYDVGRGVPTSAGGGRGAEGGKAGTAIDYLVIEFLEGATLAARLEKGALPLEQALSIAIEIADALSAAHRHGVIHRDLKPANVMLTKSGAKLLDFGLAKLTGRGEHAAAGSVASVPTQAPPLTSEGAIVGTLQYMAPEQVEGKPADARTDLWALGAILYEMLTGERAFAGTSAASLIGNIMNAEPPALATLQPLTPPALDRLVRQCLAKSPDDRWDSAHDVANELRSLRETSGVATPTGVQLRRRGLRTAAMVAALLVAAVAGAGLMWLLRPAAAVTSMVRSDLPVGPADELNAVGASRETTQLTPGGSRTALTWTPDGRALVFVGRRAGVQQLYVRRLDADEAHPLPGTEGAELPAVSPDGQSVAFWAGAAIRVVPFAGGPVTDRALGIGLPMGLVWDSAGGLFCGRGASGIWAIPAEGKPVPVTTIREGELAHMLPSLLPGGRVLLYTVRKREFSWGDEQVVAQPLPTGERKVLLTDAADARYVATGHLVFLRRGVLYAVPFDPDHLQLRGPEVAVRDGVAQAVVGGNIPEATGAGQFAVAPTGTLAWIASPLPRYADRRLVTLDRRGQVTALSASTNSYGPRVRVSPDRRRLAVTVRTLTEQGLWVCDLTRPAPPVRVTTQGDGREGEVLWPVWGPGGQRLFFRWLKDGRRSLATSPADGATPPQVLASGYFAPSSVTPDGRIAAVLLQRADSDVVVVTVENDTARVEPLIQTPDNEGWPEFSPDGHWLLYASDRTGRNEVYVRAYPGSGASEPVSLEGGSNPAWHPNGREIFFVGRAGPDGKNRMMAATFTPGSPPKIGRPESLFLFDPLDLPINCGWVRCYDVAADGQRFYATQRVPTPPAPPVTHINLIENWFEELKAKVPVKR